MEGTVRILEGLSCYTRRKTYTSPQLFRRFVGTPFPPWNEGTDVWGVQHLLNPELGEPVFAEWYGSEEMINAVCELLEVKPEELQLGRYSVSIYGIHLNKNILIRLTRIRAVQYAG